MTEPTDLHALAARDLAFRYVAATLKVDRTELESHCRQARLVEARTLFVWAVKACMGESLSYPTIGNWLGGRDHTSIMHLYRNKAPQLRQRDADFARLCDRFAELYLSHRTETLQ